MCFPQTFGERLNLSLRRGEGTGGRGPSLESSLVVFLSTRPPWDPDETTDPAGGGERVTTGVGVAQEGGKDSKDDPRRGSFRGPPTQDVSLRAPPRESTVTGGGQGPLVPSTPVRGGSCTLGGTDLPLTRNVWVDPILPPRTSGRTPVLDLPRPTS